MRKNLFLVILVSFLVTLLISPSSLVAVKSGKPSLGHGKGFIPPHAVQVAQGLFYLGTAVHKGRVVEGYMIIRPAKVKFKKPGCDNDGICEKGENKHNCPHDCVSTDDVDNRCYEHIAKGAKWKGPPEPFIVNTKNNSGLFGPDVLSVLNAGIEKWEFAAEVGDICGDGTSTNATLEADDVEPDDRNEVYFDIFDERYLAYALVWGIFYGPPSNRELVEFDIVFNDFHSWADCDNEYCSSGDDDSYGDYDFGSTATHELGHAVGMDDLYEDKCAEQTMYGYGSPDDIGPRDLEQGDINGIYDLYN